MTDNRQRVLAAASVLGLSLGMVALNAEADQVKHTTTNQIKNGTNTHKIPTTNLVKQSTDSNQIKWNGVSNQHKGQTPSPALNPQPEPPKPSGEAKPK